MGKPRYQIFVSSTFKDLQEERFEILKALQTHDYFVAGMEMFPALNQEVMPHIKKVIDEPLAQISWLRRATPLQFYLNSIF